LHVQYTSKNRSSYGNLSIWFEPLRYDFAKNNITVQELCLRSILENSIKLPIENIKSMRNFKARQEIGLNKETGKLLMTFARGFYKKD